jgi:hypothetical protein
MEAPSEVSTHTLAIPSEFDLVAPTASVGAPTSRRCATGRDFTEPALQGRDDARFSWHHIFARARRPAYSQEREARF